MPGKMLRADFFLISEGDFHNLRTLKKESYPCSASKDINGERPGDLHLDGRCFHRLGLSICAYGHCHPSPRIHRREFCRLGKPLLLDLTQHPTQLK